MIHTEEKRRYRYFGRITEKPVSLRISSDLKTDSARQKKIQHPKKKKKTHNSPKNQLSAF